MQNLLRLLFCLFVFTLISCSNPKRDYEEVQKLQDAAQLSIQNTSDYDIKIKSCDDAIAALNSFIQKHPGGEWENAAITARASWQSKKDDFEKELKEMAERLSKKLAEYAIEQAKNKHSFCNIEKMELMNNDLRKEGADIVLNQNYAVRMKGAMLGLNIFKLNVKVSGRVAMDTKKVTVDEKAVVEE